MADFLLLEAAQGLFAGRPFQREFPGSSSCRFAEVAERGIAAGAACPSLKPRPAPSCSFVVTEAQYRTCFPGHAADTGRRPWGLCLWGLLQMRWGPR